MLNNKPGTHVECVLFVMAGELRLTFDDTEHTLSPGGYAYVAPATRWPFLICGTDCGVRGRDQRHDSLRLASPQPSTQPMARGHPRLDTPPEPSDARRGPVTPEDEPCCPAGGAAQSDENAALIVDTPWPLVQQGTPAIPRGGYAGSFHDMITTTKAVPVAEAGVTPS